MLKKYILPGVVAAMVCGSGLDAAAAVVINEIMQSNIDCVYVDHEYPDSWIELYNSGSDAVDLSGWRVGVKEKLSSCYELPAGTTIGGGRYLLVYCDKSDAGGLHTTFRLESGKGGAVYLYDAEGRIADSLTGLKKMPAPGVAYGRTADGGSEWRYMVTATPGESNSNTSGTCKSGDDVHPSPLFSHDSFVSVAGSDAFTLTVSVPAEAVDGAVLCVTTDGREPQLADAVGGREWSMPVDATTVVRARLLGGGRLPVRSDVRSYIYLAEPSGMRVVSLVGDPDDFYDEVRGIYSGKPFPTI
ncbi:MAG: lamin tail domain-containing protein [Muribaculum sp.]|nr:lamin tail domain-containing protein [Muribaculum sp.]